MDDGATRAPLWTTKETQKSSSTWQRQLCNRPQEGLRTCLQLGNSSVRQPIFERRLTSQRERQRPALFDADSMARRSPLPGCGAAL